MFRRIIVFLVFVTAGIYSVNAEELTPCGDLFCAENEVCSYDKEYGEYCACAKGTTLLNNTCIEDECVKNKCPENSFCTAEFGYAECRCKDGFFLDKYHGKEVCVSKDVKNYNEIMLLNEVECTEKGICNFRFDLQYPENTIDVDTLNKQNIIIRTLETDYEGELFSGSLDKCLKNGFCKDISANTIAFSSIFPVAGKKEITVDYYSTDKSIIHESLPFVVENVAEPCDFVSCTYGTYCVNRDNEAFCKDDNNKDKDSLAYLMNQNPDPTDGGGTMLKGVVASPEEQFFYHLSESAPGTSSCQTAPYYMGTFCGESFPIILGQPRGVLIPDNDSTGITRTTSASNFDYMLDSVTVYVNITHTYIGDLVVTIVSPNGTEKIIHNRAGGSADNLSLQVDVTDFNGENPEGTWTLKVKDLAGGDEGRLTQWGIVLNSSGYKRINDYSANKRHGSYNGSSYPSGVISLAKGFDGTDDKITAFGSYAPSESLTFTGWVYPDSVTGGTKQLMHARKTNTERIRVMIYDGKVRAYVNESYIISNGSVSTGTWTHIAVSFDTVYSGSTATGTNIKIYLNNELDTADYISGQTIDTSYNYYWTFGAYSYSSGTHTLFFDGKMDEFRVYDSVLSRYQRDLVYDYGCSSGYYRRSNKSCYNTDSCGDGRWTGSEECEDQSTTGCDSNCEIVDGYYLDTCFNSCEDVYYTTYTNCGDSYQAGNEECDDGNHVIETCPTYGQSCTVCGETCDLVAGIVEECGDGIVQTSYEECDMVDNCTNCECDTGYYSVENTMVAGHYICVSVCDGVDCGTTGTCNNSTGQPICQCGYGYVARNNYCVEGWFEDTNMADAVVELLQSKGYAVEDELDIDPSTMLDDIEGLYLSNLNIQSIVGITLFTDLKELDISKNNIEDISDLGQMTKLSYLDLSYNPVSDISVLSTSNVTELDITNTAVYDYIPLKSIGVLEYITKSDENFSPVTFEKPENNTTADWINSWNNDDCYELSTIELAGTTYRKTGPGCSENGTCINGKCGCNVGYENVNGHCYEKSTTTCDTGYHLENNLCILNTRDIQCDIPKYTKLYDFENNPPQYIWNSSSQSYEIPSGKNTNACYYGDSSCNTVSICLYECPFGFTYEGGGVCDPGAYRDISAEAYNQLGMPNISRQDIALEPVPGVPSFIPSFSIKNNFQAPEVSNNNVTYPSEGGWYLNLPRAELRMRNRYTGFMRLFQLGWAKDAVTLFMPWGSEEYGIRHDEKCYEASDGVTSKSCSGVLNDDDWIEWTFFPSPGQQVFSYIVVRTTVQASRATPGVVLHYSLNEHWSITRYGDDGSVTEFERTCLRPRPYKFVAMDYIPIKTYTTRDNQTVFFDYTWERKNQNTTQANYSHWAIKTVQITDPMNRAIKIETTNDIPNIMSGSGLMGAPDLKKVYLPLEGNVDIYTGITNSLRQIFSWSLVHKVDYNEIQGPEMQVDILKDDLSYRQDEYAFDNGDLKLTSSSGAEITWKQLTATITKDGDTYHYPMGYQEIQYVQAEGYETKEKSVVMPSYYTSPSKRNNSLGYPNSFRFFNTSSGFHRDVYYYHEKDSQEVGLRKVVEKFTNWFQPTEIKTCTMVNTTTCDSNDTHTQKYGYDVFGNPVYSEDIDGKTAIDLFYMSTIGPNEYNDYFQDNMITATAKQALRKAGKVVCSANYENLNTYDYTELFENYVMNNSYFNAVNYKNNYCNNSSNTKATVYAYTAKTSSDPYDLASITSPDGIVTFYTYDYDMTTLPSGYTANGKVWGKTVTGRNSVNTQKTCYRYNNDYQLVAQGIGEAGNCSYKKGFVFDENDTSVTMIEDYSFLSSPTCGNQECIPAEVDPISNKYLHDDLGRKVAEENSAGVGTIYVYDELDRVVFTFFGCSIGSVFPDGDSTDSNVVPYNFAGSSTAGDDGSGDISFSTSSGQFNYGLFANLNVCSYYRKYKYDTMSNLTETRFFEYWGLDSNKNVQKNVYAPKTVIQLVEYDLMGRPTSSCQHKPYTSIDRCIETEQDIYGNITKKVENGVTRTVSYNSLNQPVATYVNSNLVEQNEYEDGKIKYIYNKYHTAGTPVKTTTNYDSWNRISSTEDPFGNIITKHYNTDTWLPEYSKSLNGSSLTSFQDYDFDDLGRVVETNSALFDPFSTASSITDISSIASEAILTKNYTYDADTGSITHVEDNFGRAVDYDYDYLNRIIMVDKTDADNNLTLRKRTAYDSTGRISKTQTWSKGKTTVTEYGYDFMGRVNETCVSTTVAGANVNCISPGSSCTSTDTKRSYKLYNTGGQVIWESDVEQGEASSINPYQPFQLTVGNEVVYSYNSFGEVEKVHRRMTDDGLGGGTGLDSLFSDGFITTSYEYDSLGRLETITDDNGATTNYAYSTDNLLLEEMYCMPSGCTNPRTVSYSYDSKRDVDSVTYSQINSLVNETMKVNYVRDNYGRVADKYTSDEYGVRDTDDVYQKFTYDSRNMLASAKSVDPTSTTTVLSEVSRTYDSMGFIKSETFDGGTVSSSMAWAPASKTLTETISLPGNNNIVEESVKGRASTLTYDGKQLLEYVYDYGNGNVLEKIKKNFDSQSNHMIELNYTYTDWRKTATRTEKFVDPEPDEIIADYAYTYSNGLHLIGKQENEENRREAYQYDSYYRLRRVDYNCAYDSNDPTCADSRTNVFACNTNPAESNCEDYQLDGANNIVSSVEEYDGDIREYSWDVDGFNKLMIRVWDEAQTEYWYDARDNLVDEDNESSYNEGHYTYDKINRLIAYTNENYSVTYSYDPFNRRTEKVVSYTDNSIDYEVTHKYLYSGWNVVSEEIIKDRVTTPVANISWVLNRYIDHGMDNHVMMEVAECTDDGYGNCSPGANPEEIWFHKDERGNVIAISDGDDTILERYKYSVYGDFKILKGSSFVEKNNSCWTTCDTTYTSCMAGCSDQACEDNCLSDQTTCYNTCGSNPDNVIYAGNVHNFLWGGSMFEPETALYDSNGDPVDGGGLYWMRNRYYSKSMHRFINQDPIGIWGDANNLGNGFAYVAGMVVEASDPTGLDIWIEGGGKNDKKGHLRISVSLHEGDEGYKGKGSYSSFSFMLDDSSNPLKGLFDIFGDASDELYEYFTNFYATFSAYMPGVVYEDDNKGGSRLAYLKTSRKQDAKARRILKSMVGKKGTYSVGTPAGDMCRTFAWSMFNMFKKGYFDYDYVGQKYYTPKLYDNIQPRNPATPLLPLISPEEEEEETPTPTPIPQPKTPEEPAPPEDIETPEENPPAEEEPSGEVEPEESSCSGNGEGCNGKDKPDDVYPSDPDDNVTRFSKVFMNNLLKKILKQTSSDNDRPFIKYSSDGYVIFIRNPYYRNIDPMKTILRNGHSGRGFMFVRNPFAPKDGVLWSNTYEMWQQRGFFMPEVDPWE